MSTLDKFHTILRQGGTTTEEALELFDALHTVTLDFIMGRWKGSGFKTNHRMDGLLETIGWYGKDFITPDCAQGVTTKSERLADKEFSSKTLLVKR